METRYKLVGLIKPSTFVCELNDNSQDTFHATSSVISKSKFNELFEYCKNNWSDKKEVLISHAGFYSDSAKTPRNPDVIEFFDVQK